MLFIYYFHLEPSRKSVGYIRQWKRWPGSQFLVSVLWEQFAVFYYMDIGSEVCVDILVLWIILFVKYFWVGYCCEILSSNSNSNSTFIALNLCQQADSKAQQTKSVYKNSISIDGIKVGTTEQPRIWRLRWICLAEQILFLTVSH